MEPAAVYLAIVLVVLGIWILGDGVWALLDGAASAPRKRSSFASRSVVAMMGLLIVGASLRVTPAMAAVTPRHERTMFHGEPVVEAVVRGSGAPMDPSHVATLRRLMKSDAGRSAATGSVTAPNNYTVERGDCLWRIARATLKAHGERVSGAAIADLWHAIYDLNRDVIGDNPRLIFPGQVLLLPER